MDTHAGHLVDRIVTFLRDIGIPVTERVGADSFLPGIVVSGGGIVFDPDRLAWPGDLLHEAGHIAVTDPALRPTLGIVIDDPAEEMAANAWSYAAARHLALDSRIVFHAGGYGGGGGWLADAFDSGGTVGQPMLAWFGMTRFDGCGPADAPNYPAMARWLR